MALISDEHELLDKLVASQSIKNRGKLYYPTLPLLSSTSDLEQSCVEIIKHLGKLAPRHDAIHYTRQLHSWQYDEKKSGNLLITLDISLQNNKTVALACVALAVCHEMVKRQLPARSDPLLISRLAELWCIKAGLGLVLINGISKQPTRSNFLHGKPVGICYQSPRQLALEFKQFCIDQKVPPEHIAASVYHPAKKLLETADFVLPKHVHAKKSVAEETHLRHSKQFKIAGYAVLLVVIIGLFAYIISFQPKKLSGNQVTLKQNVTRLKKLYAECLADAKEKDQAVFDKDILADGTVKAQTNRCESIKNEHDYYVGKYNTSL